MGIRDEIEFLDQIANSLQKAEVRLQQAHLNKNPEDFNNLKKFILQLQKRISEVLI
ncbi:MAG: hypothetical protein KKB31_04380 [Nanoarchaeota archaeon]|nr:hypothetical protein [Nanoarchaeota archaeon]